MPVYPALYSADAGGLSAGRQSAQPSAQRRGSVSDFILYSGSDILGGGVADLEDGAFAAVWRDEQPAGVFWDQRAGLAAGRGLGDAGHRAGIRVEGHGLFRPDPALGHDWHQQNLL